MQACVCKGTLTTDWSRGLYGPLRSHDAKLERVEATKLIASVKESADLGRAKPAYISSDHTRDATAGVRAELGNRDVVKRTFPREKVKHLPKSPVSLSDLELTGEWTTIGGVEQGDFLIHVSGPETDSKILVCASLTSFTHWQALTSGTGTVPLAPHSPSSCMLSCPSWRVSCELRIRFLTKQAAKHLRATAQGNY